MPLSAADVMIWIRKAQGRLEIPALSRLSKNVRFDLMLSKQKDYKIKKISLSQLQHEL